MSSLINLPQSSFKRRDTARIEFIDGLRGIAIGLVVLFHAFARWPDIVPYGNEFGSFPLLLYGWLGVQLFFMISGFVILMTLNKSVKFSEFILRRWLRLFPAMLICSIVVFGTASYFYERPAGVPVVSDLLPGLTFISPSWWGWLFGSTQGHLEGGFWSLYVEIQFYFLIGTLYFLFGECRSLAILTMLFFATACVKFFNAPSLYSLSDFLVPVYLGWFLVGALLFVWFRSRNASAMIWALIVSSICPFMYGPGEIEGLGQIAAGYLIILLFFVPLLSERIRSALSAKFLLFLGFISYPLYLFHENIMISLIVKTARWMPSLPSILIPLFPIGLLIFLAWLVAAYGEPWLRNLLHGHILSMMKLSRRQS
jgi:peptidoglycan/LPS O-acetylase OafA/YrhL